MELHTHKIEDVNSPFTGEVIIEVPSYLQTIEYGEKYSGEHKASAKDLVEVVFKHVKEVKLTIKDSGVVVDNLEHMLRYLEGRLLLNELSNIIMGGVRLKK